MGIKAYIPNFIKGKIKDIVHKIFYGPDPYPSYYINGEKKYLKYKDILSHYNLLEYKTIAIYGKTKKTNELIKEIAKMSCANEIILLPRKHVVGNKDCDLKTAIRRIDCLVIALPEEYTDIRYRLIKKKIKPDIIDIYDIDQFITQFHHPELEKYKDTHIGERCFVIGNGPSLKKEDLDVLHDNNVVCFAGNGIDSIFSETKWRPDYVFAIEPFTVDYIRKHMDDETLKKFCADVHNYAKHSLIKKKMDEEVFHCKFGTGKTNHPSFSYDITQKVVDSATFIYCCVQVAVYMGFKDIYLLGIDNTVGFTVYHHFSKKYMGGIDATRLQSTGYLKSIKEKINEMNLQYNAGIIYDRTNRMFESADQYLKKRGRRIFNATRGGRLEVIERVDFDELF